MAERDKIAAAGGGIDGIELTGRRRAAQPLARMRVIRRTALGGALALGLFGAAWAEAAPVKGTVTLPAPLRIGRRYPGHWRVENGSVAVQPSKGEAIVVANGPKGSAPAAKTYTVDIAGFQATPATLVIGVGSVVEFKNSDRVAHELATPAQSSLMGPERLAPGSLRRQKFLVPGGYEVRCNLYPHLAINIVVVDSPYFAVTDDKGAFKLDVPDGKATLKVWAQGRWVHEETVDVKPSMPDVQLKVAEGGRGESAE
jgi:plastocyanin